jgi:large conductance mechanosensitive channel
MLQGFKKFILRGNVVELAVGVMIGAAFNNVVNALVKDMLTPLIGAIVKIPDFSGMTFTIRGSKFLYGDLINNAVSFLLVAVAVYFFVIVPMNALVARMHGPPPEDPNVKDCPECFSEISAKARRCPHCTSILVKNNA